MKKKIDFFMSCMFVCFVCWFDGGFPKKKKILAGFSKNFEKNGTKQK